MLREIEAVGSRGREKQGDVMVGMVAGEGLMILKIIGQ
jgi:hypothetical protein